MTLWEKYCIGEKVLTILRGITAYDPDHHLGRPFITPYQLAILFKQKYPEEYAAINKGVGGEGHGKHNSLAQYLAGELSQRVKRKVIPVEGAFLYRNLVNEISYMDGKEQITSSLGQQYDLSMFRIKEEEK